MTGHIEGCTLPDNHNLGCQVTTRAFKCPDCGEAACLCPPARPEVPRSDDVAALLAEVGSAAWLLDRDRRPEFVAKLDALRVAQHRATLASLASGDAIEAAAKAMEEADKAQCRAKRMAWYYKDYAHFARAAAPIFRAEAETRVGDAVRDMMTQTVRRDQAEKRAVAAEQERDRLTKERDDNSWVGECLSMVDAALKAHGRETAPMFFDNEIHRVFQERDRLRAALEKIHALSPEMPWDIYERIDALCRANLTPPPGGATR